MKTQVIIVAAGSGSRLKEKLPKALVTLKKNPIVSWSLGVFNRCSLIDSIILVGHSTYLTQFKRIAKKFRKVQVVIAGGATRADSVRQGLKVLDENTSVVLVHDAARPLIDEVSIKCLLQALKSYQAAILAVPVKPTIKKVNERTMCVEETLPRHLLWEVQTPQGFHKDILLKAHQQKIKEEVTDDAMLVEKMGIKVKVVQGHPSNLKVTTKEDLWFAEGLL